MWLHVVDPSLMVHDSVSVTELYYNILESGEATLEQGVRNPVTRGQQSCPSSEKLCGLSGCVDVTMFYMWQYLPSRTIYQSWAQKDKPKNIL